MTRYFRATPMQLLLGLPNIEVKADHDGDEDIVMTRLVEDTDEWTDEVGINFGEVKAAENYGLMKEITEDQLSRHA